jgi:chloride channel 7
LHPLVTVGEVYDALRETRHGAFAVVADDDSRQLLGTVLRRTLCLLIDQRAYAPPGVAPASRPDLQTRALSPLLSSAVFERAYPRYPTVDELAMTDADRACWCVFVCEYGRGFLPAAPRL